MFNFLGRATFRTLSITPVTITDHRGFVPRMRDSLEYTAAWVVSWFMPEPDPQEGYIAHQKSRAKELKNLTNLAEPTDQEIDASNNCVLLKGIFERIYTGMGGSETVERLTAETPHLPELASACLSLRSICRAAREDKKPDLGDPDHYLVRAFFHARLINDEATRNSFVRRIYGAYGGEYVPPVIVDLVRGDERLRAFHNV